MREFAVSLWNLLGIGRKVSIMSKITENDLFGRFFLRTSGADCVDTYHRSVLAISPLVRSTEWNNAVSGWYINVTHGFAARLSYFTTQPNAATIAIRSYLHRNKDVREYRRHDPPVKTEIAADYGGYELRFRRYLCTYSPIALDLMEADLRHARCLCITLRCQLFLKGRPYRPHLEPTMQRDSKSYVALTESNREQFWADLQHWPNPKQQVDWVHMFVNMVFGHDLNDFCSSPPPKALTIQEINKLLQRRGDTFQIPHDWRPL